MLTRRDLASVVWWRTIRRMDPDSLIVATKVGAAAWASKELAGKLLGPTFDYLGGEIRQFAEKCNVNLTNIFVRARRKAGERIDSEGGVSPRVLKNVIDEGAFCADNVAAEYIAGILASSRVPDATDDRGVAYLSVIRELSVHQLRAHYMIYWSLKRLLDGRELSPALGNHLKKMRLFLPGDFMDRNLGITETDEVLDLHVLSGLHRHDLVGEWGGGSAENVALWNAGVNGDGYFVTPTIFGVELFLWAHGLAQVHVGDFLRVEVIIDTLADHKVEGLPMSAPDTRDDDARRRRETEAFIQRTIERRQGY